MSTKGVLGLFVLLAGCGGNVSMGAAPSDTGGSSDDASDTSVVDTGSTPGVDSSPSSDTPTSDAAAPDVPPAASSTVTGKWVGYIESYKLPSGSDAVTIELTELTDGSAIGTVIFGTKASPPPPTDPKVRYPSNLVASFPGGGTDTFYGEGFRYTMGLGKVSGKRLTMRINPGQLWKVWCELQTSYNGGSSASGTWGCLPNWGFTCCDPGPCSQPDPTTGKSVPRDCGQLYLCSVHYVCSCDEKGCTVPGPDAIGGLAFDVTVVADEMNGSISGLFGDKNVHLLRAK